MYPMNELCCFSKNLLTKLDNMNSTYYDRSGCHDIEMILGFLPFMISFSALSRNLPPLRKVSFFPPEAGSFLIHLLTIFSKTENHPLGKTSSNL